jgi:hypothetical protein
MQNRIDQVRQSLGDLRKSGKMPHWRMVYAENMLSRAQDYVAIDRLPEATTVLEKLDRWVNTHRVKEHRSFESETVPMCFWTKEILEKTVAQIRQTLAAKGMLVPPMERESINHRLKLVEQWLGEGKLQEAHDELMVLRNSLITRLRRSFRARISALTAYKTGTQPEGSLIGLYNAQHTLEETLHIVGERDPIWIEDFLEIYNELFRVVEKIVPQDKR